ncbi:hypothetical protein NSTC731_00113 [Nostoc sp. DSM 114167]|jgi:hypothetical protein
MCFFLVPMQSMGMPNVDKKNSELRSQNSELNFVRLFLMTNVPDIKYSKVGNLYFSPTYLPEWMLHPNENRYIYISRLDQI